MVFGFGATPGEAKARIEGYYTARDLELRAGLADED